MSVWLDLWRGISFLGGRKKGMILRRCAVMAIFWVIWEEKYSIF